MLVLTRKLNQSIRIGDSITISVLRVRGNTVQLGIQAPKEVHVLRSELLAKGKQIDSATQLPAAEAHSELGEAATSADEEEAEGVTLDVNLSLYLPEDYVASEKVASEKVDESDACEFDSYLQQYMFAP